RQPNEDEHGEERGSAIEKVARLRRVGLRPESLDAPVGADEQTELGESIPDEQTQTPFELLREKDFSDQINRVLKSVKNRDATIIAERFGLNGTTAKPLEQVAEIIGVTRERVPQLQLSALATLRHAVRQPA